MLCLFISNELEIITTNNSTNVYAKFINKCKKEYSINELNWIKL